MKKRKLHTIFALSFLLLFPKYAFAMAVFTSFLGKVLAVLTGGEAIIGASIAVVVFGWLSQTGRIPWSVGGSVIFGIVIVFGGPQIVTWIKP